MSGDTLVLSGIMRSGGNTEKLLDALIGQNRQDCIFTGGYGSYIRGCVNCGTCKNNGVCSISDDMEIIYRAAQNCKRVIIASPVYFGNLTGRLLDIMSRFQRYFKNGYNVIPKVGPLKEGAFILTAGGNGNVSKAETDAALMMKMLNVEDPVFITSRKTDVIPSADDKDSLDKIKELRARWYGL